MSTSIENDDSICYSTPAGWHMPSEWSKHIGCLILYPHNRAVFRGHECEYARAQVLEVAKAISNLGEIVFLFCLNEETSIMLQEKLGQDFQENNKNKKSGIVIRVLESDDTWARDTGPTFLTKLKTSTNEVNNDEGINLMGIHWDFNAYGGPIYGCYEFYENDKLIAHKMINEVSHYFDFPVKRINFSSASYNESLNNMKHEPFILEGGSIHTDGQGTILTTEECLLNHNRNPKLSKAQIESKLLSSLGAEKVIWLPRGLYKDDDTNGHVDNICCFVEPGHVVLAWTNDTTDPQYEISCEALSLLETCTDAKGRKITVTKLLNPPPLSYTKEEIDSFEVDEDGINARQAGTRLAASYVNFYIANEGIIVPGFGVKETDLNAVQTLQSLFPDRKVVQVESREILLGGGNIHCITQQIPDPLP